MVPLVRVLLLTALICPVSLAQTINQSRNQIGNQDQDRYRIVSAQRNLSCSPGTVCAGEVVIHEIFLLDAQTGKVWRYFSNGGAMVSVPSPIGPNQAVGSGAFIPVERIEHSTRP